MGFNRRKEFDEYNNKKAATEKELSELKNNLLKQEANYDTLKMQVEQIPIQIKEAVTSAEELLSTQLSQQYEFETQLKQKESEGILKLKEQSINYLEDQIKRREVVIQDLIDKADLATTQQVQDTDDFKTLLLNSKVFVDKSLLIKEVIEDSAIVMLITRTDAGAKVLIWI